MRRVMWKILLVLVVALALTLRCTCSKKTKNKLLKKLSHIGHQKVSQQQAQKGQKKNAMQPPNEQAAIMANPERLDSTEREELNQLQNFNKQYLNNEMAAETAVLADQGIDDDSALRISNMAALSTAPMNAPNAGVHAAIKAKISNGFNQGSSGVPNQASSMAYDPNAYLYDEKSWPEYRIHDSDYSNYRTFEMNNLVNGDNSDMMFGGQNAHPNFQDMPGDEGTEFQGPRPPQYGSFQGGKPSEPTKSESKPNIATFKAGQAEGFPIGYKEKQKLSDGSATAGANKPQSSVSSSAGTAQGQVPLASKSESTAPEAPKDASQKQQQKEQSLTAPPPPPSPKQEQQQQQQIQPQQTQQQPQQKQEQQRLKQQQDKANPVKLAASVVQAAASMPPKAIASLVSSLVGKEGAAAATLGQIQNKIAGSVSKSISQDINQAAPEVTQLQKVSKAKKH